MAWLTGERWPVVPSSTSTLFVCPWLLTARTERKSTSKCLGQSGTLPSPGLSLWWGGHYLSHVIFLNQFTDRLWPRVLWRSQKCAVTLRQCFKSILNWLTAFQRIRTFNVTISRFHGFFSKKYELESLHSVCIPTWQYFLYVKHELYYVLVTYEPVSFLL